MSQQQTKWHGLLLTLQSGFIGAQTTAWYLSTCKQLNEHKYRQAAWKALHRVALARLRRQDKKCPFAPFVFGRYLDWTWLELKDITPKEKEQARETCRVGVYITNPCEQATVARLLTRLLVETLAALLQHPMYSVVGEVMTYEPVGYTLRVLWVTCGYAEPWRDYDGDLRQFEIGERVFNEFQNLHQLHVEPRVRINHQQRLITQQIVAISAKNS